MLVFVELSFVSHPGRLVQPLYDAETGGTRIRQNKEGEQIDRCGSKKLVWGAKNVGVCSG